MRIVADEHSGRMIFATRRRCAERAQQLVNLRFIPRDKGPTFTGVKFCSPGFEAFGSVSRRIDADGNEANVWTHFVAELFLYACESCAERRTNRRAGSKDEIDNYCLAFYEIRVEMNLPPVLVQELGIRDIHLRRQLG